MIDVAQLPKRAVPFALALGIWFAPVPAGLTAQAWHLFLPKRTSVSRISRRRPVFRWYETYSVRPPSRESSG